MNNIVPTTLANFQKAFEEDPQRCLSEMIRVFFSSGAFRDLIAGYYGFDSWSELKENMRTG